MRLGFYLRLLLSFLHSSWMNVLEYRADFLIWVAVDIGWTTMDVVFYLALINYVELIGNWGVAETIVVLGLFRILTSFMWGWMVENFGKIPFMVEKGELDLLLVKPVDAQFVVSFRRGIAFSLMSSVIAGTALIWYGLLLRGIPISPFQWFGFAVMFAVGVTTMYACYFLLICGTFFVDRLNMTHFFSTLFDYSKYPKEVYGIVGQRIMTSVLPIGLILTMPSDVLFGTVSWPFILWSFVLMIGYFFITRWVWQHGLRRYGSAA
jgi:ABC-2 type transport system permease protein